MIAHVSNDITYVHVFTITAMLKNKCIYQADSVWNKNLKAMKIIQNSKHFLHYPKGHLC